MEKGENGGMLIIDNSVSPGEGAKNLESSLKRNQREYRVLGNSRELTEEKKVEFISREYSSSLQTGGHEGMIRAAVWLTWWAGRQ